MPSFNMEFDQASVDRLKSKLAKSGIVAETIGMKSIKQNTEDVKKYAQVLVPKDTHNLRKNIKTRYEDEGLSGVIYVDIGDAHYGWWVEKGTSRMSARPYLQPSYEKYCQKFKRDIAKEWQKNLFR
ncbi:MAG: HK97-gp10 family putative phage morphogenesis protein [Paraclostridium sp.]